MEVTGQRLDLDRAVLACRIIEPDRWCRRCGEEGICRDTVTRQLVHEPLGWRPTEVGGHGAPLPMHWVRQCVAPGRQQGRAARAKLSRYGLRWALQAIVCQHLTGARMAEGLGVYWNTDNAVLAEGKRMLIEDPGRFEGVRVIGVDEHVWRHTRRGDKYVTVIIDLPGARDRVIGTPVRADWRAPKPVHGFATPP